MLGYNCLHCFEKYLPRLKTRHPFFSNFVTYLHIVKTFCDASHSYFNIEQSSRILIFSKNECLNGCNLSFAESRVEECLKLNFRYVDYQTLVQLSYSSYVCWISVCATRAKCFLSVRVPSNASKPDQNEIHCEG